MTHTFFILVTNNIYKTRLQILFSWTIHRESSHSPPSDFHIIFSGSINLPGCALKKLFVVPLSSLRCFLVPVRVAASALYSSYYHRVRKLLVTTSHSSSYAAQYNDKKKQAANASIRRLSTSIINLLKFVVLSSLRCLVPVRFRIIVTISSQPL